MTKILLLLFILLPVTAFGEIVAGRFTVTTSASQRGNLLKLSGSINSGPKCDDINIRIVAVSDRGQTAVVYSLASYSGMGSSPFEAKKEIYLSSDGHISSWKITQTSAECN